MALPSRFRFVAICLLLLSGARMLHVNIVSSSLRFVEELENLA